MRHQAVLEKRVYPDPGFAVSAWRGEGFSFLAHWHTEVEVMLILEGHLVVGINQDQRTLGPGDLAVAGSHDIHWYEKSDAARQILLIFRPELIGHPSWPWEGPLNGTFVLASEPGAGEMGALVQSVVDELGQKRDRYQTVIRGQLTLLCGLMERHLGTPRLGRESDRRSAHQQLLREALDFVHHHFQHPIGLEDAARRVSWSPFHFSRVFSQTVGMNFRTYLNGVRVEAAEELLRSTTRPITEIAFECGFETLRTFNRAFKAKRGITPRQVRLS